MTVKEKFAYASLHPYALALHLLVQIAFGMFLMHPVVVSISLFFSIVMCLNVYGKKFLKELRIYLPFYLIVALANPLFSHNGATPLFFMNGRPITYEAAVYGFVSAGMFLSILLWCHVWSGVMTEDKLLYLIGRRFPKIGLVLSVTLRMIPRFVDKWREIGEAQATLGGTRRKVFDKIKNALRMFSALITQAMESSVETGMSMAARGYGLPGRKDFVRYRFRKSDLIFVCVNIALMIFLIVTIAQGTFAFNFYPHVSNPDRSLLAIAAYSAFFIQSSMLFLLQMKEEVVWTYSQSRI